MLKNAKPMDFMLMICALLLMYVYHNTILIWRMWDLDYSACFIYFYIFYYQAFSHSPPPVNSFYHLRLWH